MLYRAPSRNPIINSNINWFLQSKVSLILNCRPIYICFSNYNYKVPPILRYILGMAINVLAVKTQIRGSVSHMGVPEVNAGADSWFQISANVVSRKGGIEGSGCWVPATHVKTSIEFPTPLSSALSHCWNLQSETVDRNSFSMSFCLSCCLK